MRTLYLDCGMGAAGDMLTASLLQLFSEPVKQVKKLNDLKIPGVKYQLVACTRGGIRGYQVRVFVKGQEENPHMQTEEQIGHKSEEPEKHTQEHGHHSMSQIVRLINRLKIEDQVKQDAVAVYKLIAKAEGKAHGQRMDEIHFHEVGTMDAVADVVAVCYLLNELQVDQILASPVRVGYGHVKCAHGILPVPAPATAYLMKEIPMYAGDLEGEFCTPTGAALLKHFVKKYEQMPVLQMEEIGYGFGKREYERLNCVRAILGETKDKVEEEILELCCNLDDMTSEEIGYATELLIATDSEDESQPMTEKEKEAVMVAERIQELVGHFPVTDDQTGEQRPAKYSDIVLLFRATTGWDEDFRRILTQKGIPVHITSKTGYFQTLEIQGIVNLLRVLDNPLQDIPLYGVLKLPCFDITEAEVAMLRCAAKERTADKQFLYEEICQYCKEPPAQDSTVYDEILIQKLTFLLQKLEQYRRMVAYTPIKELLGFLIQDTGYDTYVSSMPGGDQRQANIALLLERAGNFEKTSFYGLFHFIRYLETMQEQEVDFGEANILDESADVVRVMTIHKSKGLEFPICFVCGLAKQFNQMDARASILMDVELGIGIDYIDPVMRTRRKTMRKNVVAQRMKEDTRGEDLRVLYVALTRAKEKLILTAYQGEKLDKKLSDRLYLTMENAQKLPFSVVMGSSCYFDMILSALMRHRDMAPLLEERGLPYEKHQLPYGEIPLQIRLWQQDNSLEKQVKETGKAAMLEEALAHTAEYADTQLEQKLSDKLNFQYPYVYLEGLTVKTTVSELKKAAYEEEAEPAAELIVTAREPYIPRFISGEEAVQGTQYGTAVHKVMELLSFDASYQNVPSDKVYMGKIWGEMQAWIAEGRVQKEDIACVNTSRIASFFHSNLAKRMISAQQRGELYREQPY